MSAGAPRSGAHARAGCLAAMQLAASARARPAAAPRCAARRAQVGGQAVIEGVMMRGVDNWSLAVRRPDDIDLRRVVAARLAT